MNSKSNPCTDEPTDSDGAFQDKHMTVLSEHAVPEVFEAMDNAKRRLRGAEALFYGHRIDLRSQRLRNFRENGVHCVSCGIKGSLFRLERHTKQETDKDWHLNLYAFDDSGKMILMTRDHIIPRSKKGPNKLYNLQPMCEKCNRRKGSMDQETFERLHIPWERRFVPSRTQLVRMDTLKRRMKFFFLTLINKRKVVPPARVNTANKSTWLGFILQ